MFNEEQQQRLRLCREFPSLPTVALNVIELAENGSADIGKVADALAMDPALSVKILRAANSPLYGRRRGCANLRQALLMLGTENALTLALTFFILPTSKKSDEFSFDHDIFWRRSLLAGAAARVIAEYYLLNSTEEVYLAALLQDVAILAIEKLRPGIYRKRDGEQVTHTQMVLLEKEHFSADHAEVGAWLLKEWKFPVIVQEAIATSHLPPEQNVPQEDKRFANIVRLSGLIADLWLVSNNDLAIAEVRRSADRLLGINKEILANLLTKVAAKMPAIDGLLNAPIDNDVTVRAVMSKAQELLVLRKIQSIKALGDIQEDTESLQSRANELEEKSRRDILTGIYNRGHMDMVLNEEFEQALNQGWSICIAFVDIDHFKQINDRYGHHAGDMVLIETTKMLSGSMRSKDFMARYGGEEFVMVLPGTGLEGARILSERLLETFRSTTFDVGEDEKLSVTISIGLAVHGESEEFSNASELLRAADRAVYTAKLEGRDRLSVYDGAGHRKEVNYK